MRPQNAPIVTSQPEQQQQHQLLQSPAPSIHSAQYAWQPVAEGAGAGGGRGGGGNDKANDVIVAPLEFLDLSDVGDAERSLLSTALVSPPIEERTVPVFLHPQQQQHHRPLLLRPPFHSHPHPQPSFIVRPAQRTQRIQFARTDSVLVAARVPGGCAVFANSESPSTAAAATADWNDEQHNEQWTDDLYAAGRTAISNNSVLLHRRTHHEEETFYQQQLQQQHHRQHQQQHHHLRHLQQLQNNRVTIQPRTLSTTTTATTADAATACGSSNNSESSSSSAVVVVGAGGGGRIFMNVIPGGSGGGLRSDLPYGKRVACRREFASQRERETEKELVVFRSVCSFVCVWFFCCSLLVFVCVVSFVYAPLPKITLKAKQTLPLSYRMPYRMPATNISALF